MAELVNDFQRVWAVDPGAVATGIAWLEATGKWSAKQYTDPVEAFEVIQYDLLHWDALIVEDYSHGGAFTKEAKATIEILGLFKYAPQLKRVTPVIRHKDKRLSGQREAAKLMGSDVSILKDDDNRKDAFSALAHCVTWRRDHAGVQG